MATSDAPQTFEALLEHLKRIRGFDFTGYKRSSLIRRIDKRMGQLNDELRTRSDQLNDVNSFMESILASLRGAVVVVDQEYRVLIWSNKAEARWKARIFSASTLAFPCTS
jgi:CheR methyltransferase, all-alpha domain